LLYTTCTEALVGVLDGTGTWVGSTVGVGTTTVVDCGVADGLGVLGVPGVSDGTAAGVDVGVCSICRVGFSVGRVVVGGSVAGAAAVVFTVAGAGTVPVSTV